MVLGSTQPPTEMSIKNIFFGVKATRRYSWWQILVPIVLKSGKLDLRACPGLYGNCFKFNFPRHKITLQQAAILKLRQSLYKRIRSVAHLRCCKTRKNTYCTTRVQATWIFTSLKITSIINIIVVVVVFNYSNREKEPICTLSAEPAYI